MGGLAARGWRRGLRVAAAGCALAVSVACASVPRGGAQHVVRPGENLYRISLHYGVSVESIRRANGIRDVTNLQVGQRLRIPGTGGSQPGGALAPDGDVAVWTPRHGDRARALREADLSFTWPVDGKVSSGFGWRRGSPHEGIDIPARHGTKVRAAEAGRVIHSARLGDYGNVVIVKHAGRYSTVYAHNAENKVRKGSFIEKGDVIATVGRTGNASGPHLHFEVRRDRVAHDPLDYLPTSGRPRR